MYERNEIIFTYTMRATNPQFQQSFCGLHRLLQNVRKSKHKKLYKKATYTYSLEGSLFVG